MMSREELRRHHGVCLFMFVCLCVRVCLCTVRCQSRRRAVMAELLACWAVTPRRAVPSRAVTCYAGRLPGAREDGMRAL